VIEAREAVKQATETLKQGRSIMLFTVVTIIFLPLGFCASVFGMNTAEFNGGLLTLHAEFYYMFPISIAIIFTSFILAFSSSTFLSSLFALIWVMVSYPVNIGFTWVLTKSGMFTMSRRLAGKAKMMKDRERGKTGLMMAEAMREKMDLKEKIEGWSQGPGEVIDAGRKAKEKVKGVGKGIMKIDVESLGSAEV
jgi:type IV secretory pathway TraG/TraD family ATPase VirD4